MQHIAYILQARVIQHQLKLGALGAFEQAADSFWGGAFLRLSEGFHGRCDENELLLEVVEADDSIDFIPILHFGV